MGDPWTWDIFLWRLTSAAIYIVVGLALFGATYLIIDKVTPFSLRKTSCAARTMNIKARPFFPISAAPSGARAKMRATSASTGSSMAGCG